MPGKGWVKADAVLMWGRLLCFMDYLDVVLNALCGQCIGISCGECCERDLSGSGRLRELHCRGFFVQRKRQGRTWRNGVEAAAEERPDLLSLTVQDLRQARTTSATVGSNGGLGETLSWGRRR